MTQLCDCVWDVSKWNSGLRVDSHLRVKNKTKEQLCKQDQTILITYVVTYFLEHIITVYSELEPLADFVL